ncbi:MAG: BppU family phage baseplate upper protein [Enterococcus casseliflavus]|nr:BppU family phage baseplate upper protein [Enterococcus casseliflavus]MDU5814356.1 BppU family phage baseplate upper protein [Enterococcus casseliflavus]
MIELHLDKRVAISPTPITLRVGDQSIQHEEFVLYQNGDYYAIPENAKVMFEGNLYNGQLTSGECEILDRSKGKVKYTFSSGNASVEGAYKRAYLRVYKSDIELVSSENIRIIVLENADLDNGTAEAYENRLEKKLDEFDDKLLEVDSAVTTAKTDIAAKVEDVSIVGESAKTNITKWATETQAIAQTEQAKIQAEAKRLTENANQKIAEYDQKFQQTEQNIATLDQNLTELRNGMKLSEAWAWSADGTDRFTTVYPGENLFIVQEWEKLPPRPYSGYISQLQINLEPHTEYVLSTNIPNWADNSTCDLFVFDSSGTYNSLINGVALNKPRKVTTLADGVVIVACRFQEFSSGEMWAKLEIGDTPTIYTPAPSEDYANAYPQYRGLALLPSDLPEDYVWEESAERIKQLAQKETDKLKGEVADIQNWIRQQGGTA